MRKCPFCGRQYKPTHPSKELAVMFGDAEAREQWITGCCSTACWDKSVPEDDDSD